MNREHITMIVEKAICSLISNQFELLDADVSERALSHHLANYIAKELPKEFHVDVEYNRHLADPKRLYLPPRKALDREIRATTVFPDIIVHKIADAAADFAPGIDDSSEASTLFRYALETNTCPYSAGSKVMLTVETTVSSYILGRERGRALILQRLCYSVLKEGKRRCRNQTDRLPGYRRIGFFELKAQSGTFF